MRRDTLYLSVFSPNAEKCGLEKLRIQTFSTQCPALMNPTEAYLGSCQIIGALRDLVPCKKT